MVCERIELQREFAYVGDTKTDEPRAVYLPPVVVAAIANHPRGLDRTGRLFRFHDGGRLRYMLKEACQRAGVTLPRRTAFHVFRHNYATWMRLYGGLDSLGLTRTGAWADMDSVARYSHSETTAEARQAAKLPTPKRGADVESIRRLFYAFHWAGKENYAHAPRSDKKREEHDYSRGQKEGTKLNVTVAAKKSTLDKGHFRKRSIRSAALGAGTIVKRETVGAIIRDATSRFGWPMEARHGPPRVGTIIWTSRAALSAGGRKQHRLGNS
jgi:hypothetical protein